MLAIISKMKKQKVNLKGQPLFNIENEIKNQF